MSHPEDDEEQAKQWKERYPDFIKRYEWILQSGILNMCDGDIDVALQAALEQERVYPGTTEGI